MSQRRLMVQMKPEVNMGEIHRYIEDSEARSLPAPLIFPPVFNLEGSEETIDKFKQQYGDQFMRIMMEQSLDDE